MYGYIYKTTNLINNKIYIGQHKSKIFDIKYYGSGKLLHRAIDKYGIENFKCELLEECNSKQDLNDREIYYIKLFDSRNESKGYNICKGGERGPGGPMFAGHHHSLKTRQLMNINRRAEKNANLETDDIVQMN